MSASQKFNLSKWLRSRTGLVLIAFLAIAAFFLITEHTAHVFGILPYALLLLSVLLFLFLLREEDNNRTHDERPQAKEEK